MNTVTIRLGDDDTLVDVGGLRHVMPVGAVSLTSAEFASDPPKPEELTNAIGTVVDHLDDMLRALPGATEADAVGFVGELATVIAAVEFGGPPPLPFPLPRAAAEDVFRTVATESSAERARNPGLPTNAVDTIVGACCIVVAVMRHLHLQHVDIRHIDIRQIDVRSPS